jgi:hypothetical protein
MRDDFDLVGFGDEPDEPDEQDELDESGLPWPPAPTPPPPPPGAAHRRGVRVAAFAGTAVVAAAVGFGVARAALDEVRASPTAASSPSSPAPSSPAPSSPAPGSGGVIPPAGPGQDLQLEIGGEVTAVSATSITLGAGAQHVTAAITRATTVTGRVRSVSGIKVGDLVSARITGTDGKLTVVAIQDPASVP